MKITINILGLHFILCRSYLHNMLTRRKKIKCCNGYPDNCPPPPPPSPEEHCPFGLRHSYKQSPICVLLKGCSASSRESQRIFVMDFISVRMHAVANAEVYLELCQTFIPLSANTNSQTQSNNLSAKN